MPGENLYAEVSIDECFTEEEIEQLRGYLERVHGDKLHATEVNLPMPECMPYGAIGALYIFKPDGEISAVEDYYMLNKEEEYFLPFKVWGYFDTEEPADEAEELTESGIHWPLFGASNMPPTISEVHCPTKAMLSAKYVIPEHP